MLYKWKFGLRTENRSPLLEKDSHGEFLEGDEHICNLCSVQNKVPSALISSLV